MGRMNYFVWSIVLLVLISCCYADCPPDCNPEWSYTDYGAYNNAEFYETCDFNNADFNWAAIQWNRVPAERIKEVPAERIIYARLNFIQKLEMTAPQISLNFDDIDDLTTEVNKDAAIEAIKETYGVEVLELDSGANVKYGTLRANSGDMEFLPLKDISENVQIEVTKTGEIFVYGMKNPPKKGIFTIDTGHYESISYADFVDQPLPDGANPPDLSQYEFGEMEYRGSTIKGRMSIYNGQPYVKEGNTVIVDNVEISSLCSDSGECKYFPEDRVKLFFDGEEHWQTELTEKGKKIPDGNYVSVSKQKGKIIMGKGKDGTSSVYYKIKFQEENPFFNNFEVGDKLYFDTKGVSGAGTIAIESRENLIPLVTVKTDSNSVSMRMVNGEGKFTLSKKLDYLGGRISALNYYSVPFTLRLEDTEGNNKLKGDDTHIIFDNSNNYAFFENSGFMGSSVELARECLGCSNDFSESEMAFNAKRLILRGVHFFGDLDVNSVEKYSGYLDMLPPKVADSITGVGIGIACKNTDATFSFAVAACAPGSTINVPSLMEPFIGYGVFRHEAGHTLHYSLDRKEEEFSQKWEEISKDENGILPWNKHPQIVAEVAPPLSIDGCVSSYGTKNIYEDVAEYSRTINQPGFLHQFLENDPRVKKKIELLYEYGFMTTTEYNGILNYNSAPSTFDAEAEGMYSGAPIGVPD